MEDTYSQIDREIQKLDKNFDIFTEISPVNEEAEKEKFYQKRNQGESYEPEFRYRGVDEEALEEMRSSVEEMDKKKRDLGDRPIDDLYKKTVESCEYILDMAENIGNPEMKDISAKFFGKPSKKASELAEQILENGCNEHTEENIGTPISSEKVVEKIEILIESLGLEWETEMTKRGSNRTDPTNQKIIIRKNESGYAPERVERLKRHEIGVHALRAENGRNQDFKILSRGVSDYNKTEEGLATYIEELTGYLDPEVIRRYAARVKAVKNMMEGKSFEETYDMLREKGIDDEYRSWRTTTRAFRGGGFCKDHIYLEGYLEVKNYIEEEGGRLSDLYIGKVSVEDAEKLKEVDEIKDPEYTPSVIDRKISEKW